MWKKSLFTDNDISLPNKFFEDVFTVINLFYLSKTVVIDSRPLYYYTKHSDSIVNSINIKKIDDYIDSFGSIRCFLHSKNIFKNYIFSYNILGYKVMFLTIKMLLKMGLGYKLSKKVFKNKIKKIFYFMGKDFDSFEFLKMTNLNY